MRPRVFPAEDAAGDGDLDHPGRSFNEAAGIPRGRPPRLFAAEPRRGQLASMRPRVFPAEDALPSKRKVKRTKSFNEAAGIPRGRRRVGW